MSAQKNIMRPRGTFEKREPKEFEERVIEIARVSRVAKGGRRIRFRALVVIGNHNGKVGMGVAKANEVAEAVKKAVSLAKKRIVIVPIINGTIPYEMIVKHGGARVMLKPATSGTSIVAGGSVRFVAEMAGITDLLAKSMGSSNKINNVTATIKALSSFNEDIIAKLKKFTDREKTAKPEIKIEEAVISPISEADTKPQEKIKTSVQKKKVVKKSEAEELGSNVEEVIEKVEQAEEKE